MRTPLHTYQAASKGSLYWSVFSQDGKQLFSGGDGTMIWIWDRERAMLVHSVETHLATIYDGALHPDGRHLAVGGAEGVILLLDTITWQVVWQRRRHREAVVRLRFADQGRLLVSAGWDRTVRLSDAATGKRIGVLKKVGFSINDLAVDRQMSYIAASYSYGARVWNQSATHHVPYCNNVNGPTGVALLGEQPVLWVALRHSPELQRWNLEHGMDEPMQPVEVGCAVHTMAVSHNERLVALGGWKEIVLLRTTDQTILDRWEVPLCYEAYRSGAVGRLQFSQDDRLLVATHASSQEGGGGIQI